MASSNPYVAYQSQMNGAYGNSARYEGLLMKQNVIDAGLKLHLVGTEARLRPFFGGGGAYSKSYLNFNSQVLQQMANYSGGQNLNPDYDISSFLGYLSTGMDVRVAKGISVGAEFKYYKVLSSSESSQIGNYYGAMYYNPYVPQSDTAQAGGTLAQSSFYSILGNLSFAF
jgi:outer membrane protein W